MSARSKLNRAITALEETQRRLYRLRQEAPDEARPEINRAINEVEEAIGDIRRARRDVDD